MRFPLVEADTVVDAPKRYKSSRSTRVEFGLLAPQTLPEQEVEKTNRLSLFGKNSWLLSRDLLVKTVPGRT